MTKSRKVTDSASPRSIINEFLNKMRPYLEAAGVPKAQLNVRSGNHKVDTYLHAFDWLHDLFMHHDYEHHVYVYDLITPKMWLSYKQLGITGLREQSMLVASSLTVRKLWKLKRPQIFGKDKHANNKKTN